MQMRFQNIDPHPLLKSYIEKMWLFESNGQVPLDDMKLIVPNGRIKLLVPFRNGIGAKLDGWSHNAMEHSITLIGLIDIPCIVDLGTNDVTGTIGIEFSPKGAYRFFHLQLCEIKNQIHPLTNILGKIARQLEEQISNIESIEGKVALLQQFLLLQFSVQKEDTIFEYCVEKIKSSKGRITIKELEKKTGYSSRWLNLKFTHKLGISPKNLASIIRFKQYYLALANNDEMSFIQNEFYNFYYDQSHFIKEFKRFTGLSTKGFENKTNNFGKIFYKE